MSKVSARRDTEGSMRRMSQEHSRLQKVAKGMTRGPGGRKWERRRLRIGSRISQVEAETPRSPIG